MSPERRKYACSECAARAGRRIDGGLGGGQRLPQHLAAEHVAGADVAALATEQVVFQPLQREQFDQFGDGGGHWGIIGRPDAGGRVARRRLPPVIRCAARMPLRESPDGLAVDDGMRAIWLDALKVQLGQHLVPRE